MLKEINEAIKKNLPQEVGELLKKELDELKDLRKLKKVHLEKIEQLNIDIESLNSEYSIIHEKNQILIEKEKDVINREKAVSEREIELKLLEQKAKLTAEFSERTVVNAMNFYSIPFKNTTLRETFNKTLIQETQFVQQGTQYNSNTGNFDEHVLANKTPVEVQDVKETTKE